MLEVVSGSACLLPPQVTALEDIDNSPPRIDPQSLNPDPMDGPASVPCTSRLFNGVIEDPDEDDTLYWRVFLDFDRDPDPFGVEAHRSRGGRREPIEFEVHSDDPRLVPRTDDTHTVELYVVDRPFLDDPTVKPRARAMKDEAGLAALMVWAIELQQDCP